MNCLPGDSIVLGDRRVTAEAVLEGELEVAPGRPVRPAPADLAVGVIHQLLFRRGCGKWFGKGGVDLGEDEAPLLEEVGVVITLDGDAEPLEDPVDEADSLITV